MRSLLRAEIKDYNERMFTNQNQLCFSKIYTRFIFWTNSFILFLLYIFFLLAIVDLDLTFLRKIA